MTGRSENKAKAERDIKKKIRNYPDYVEDFYNYLVANRKEYTTCRQYVTIVGNFLLFCGLKDILTITMSDVVNFMNTYESSSDAYRSLVWSSLHKFFDYMVAVGKMEINFCSSGLIEKPSIKDQVKRTYMTSEELGQVLKYVKKGGSATGRVKARRLNWVERDLAIINILMVTGMRVSALVQINVDDYDAEVGVITVLDKGSKTFRYELDSETRKILDKWLIKREEKLGYVETTPAMFISSKRGRMTDQSVRDLVKKYTDFLPKHITPHKFRSSFGTNLYVATKDPYEVQRQMGHANFATTQIYLSGLETDSKKATNTIRDMVNAH